jgi:aspartate aminotransferase-like enzyme
MPTTAARWSTAWRRWASSPSCGPRCRRPIIVTFHAPAHPAYDFKRFYEGAKARGFMLYPGKLTQVETFRVGCIGAIGRNEMRQAVDAVADTLREMGIDADERLAVEAARRGWPAISLRD